MTSEVNSNSNLRPKQGFWGNVRHYLKHLPNGFSITLIVVTISFLVILFLKGFGLLFFLDHVAPLDGDTVEETFEVLGLNVPEILLPVMLISGVIVMVISIGLLVVAYDTFDPKLITLKHSLGLPEGSVRSLVALMLILLFSILSVHIYWKMAQTKPIRLTEVNYVSLPSSQVEALRDATPPENWISSNCSYQMVAGEFQESCSVVLLEVREERNRESERFAQQVLTTTSTLVIALAGFYFGSRAVNLAGDLSHQSAKRAFTARDRERQTRS
jgi:hypothetical protein